MSLHEDISWQVLRQIVHNWAGTAAELAEVKPLDGGMINTTLCLTLKSGERAVIKISPHRINRDYEREAHQLDFLRALGLPTPRVYGHFIGSLDQPNSFILMEFLEGIDLLQAKRQCSAEQFDGIQHQLAEMVLRMHEQTSPTYQRVMTEPKKTFEKWCDFYRHVYDQIVQRAGKNNELSPKARKQIAKVHEKLERLIAHNDVPRLVHWDIWSTNMLANCDEEGEWKICALLDPNCKYAHAEAELAYMDLFHTSTPAFLKKYQETHRLEDGYHRVRKHVYQLYPLINHVNLFGHEYVRPMIAMLEKVSGLI